MIFKTKSLENDVILQPCDEPRSMASINGRVSREVDPRGQIDTDLPEEFQGLEGVDVESRADITGLGPLPRPGRPNVSFFLRFLRGRRGPHCKECAHSKRLIILGEHFYQSV